MKSTKFLIDQNLSKRYRMIVLIPVLFFVTGLGALLFPFAKELFSQFFLGSSGPESLPTQFLFVALSVMVIYFPLQTALPFFKRWPSPQKVQVASYRNYFLRNIVAFSMLVLLPIAISVVLFDVSTKSGGESSHDWSFWLLFIAFNLALCWWILPLQKLIAQLKNYWKHVNLTGHFHRGSYAPGQRVNFILTSRQAGSQEVDYKVHLHYVREGWDRKAQRKILHQEEQELSATALAVRGADFVLPPVAQKNGWFNRLDDQANPRYWEVLVQEGDLVFARFIVPMERLEVA